MSEPEYEPGACLAFQRRPLLRQGMLYTGTGVNKGKNAILIDAEDSAEEQAITLWHEMIHLIQLAGGLKPEDHDEAYITETAKKLAAVCPEVVNWAFLKGDNYQKLPRRRGFNGLLYEGELCEPCDGRGEGGVQAVQHGDCGWCGGLGLTKNVKRVVILLECVKCGWKGTDDQVIHNTNTRHFYSCPDCLTKGFENTEDLRKIGEGKEDDN